MAWGNGYTYRRTVTIDHTKVPNTDQTDFPLLLYGTYSYLAVTGSGGDLTNSNGYDLIITSDAAGSTILPFQLVRYVSTSGLIELWVKVPTVATATDTVLYMFYKNASITTYQGNNTGTWASEYVAVYHLADGTTLAVTDSTSNANNLTNSGMTATTGEIDGGAAGVSGSGFAMIASNATFNTSDYTISAWVKFSGTSAGGINAIMSRGPDTNSAGHYFLYRNGSGKLTLDIPFVVGGVVTGATTLADGTWYHVAATKSGSAYKLYVNGVQDGSATNATAPTQSGQFNLGSYQLVGTDFYLSGSIDEGRVISGAKSADYLKTSVNNQSAPGTFYTLGAAVLGGHLFRNSSLDGLGGVGQQNFNPSLGGM